MTMQYEHKLEILTLNTTTGFSLHVSPTIRLTSPRARALTSKFNTSYDPPNSLTRAAIQVRVAMVWMVSAARFTVRARRTAR